MKKSLKEQIARMNQISKLSEGYTIDELSEADEDMPIGDEEIPNDEGIDDAEGDMGGEEDPFAGIDDETGDDSGEVDAEVDTDEEVVEIDVTELINKTNQALQASEETSMSVDNMSAKLDGVFQTVKSLSDITKGMDSQVRLMKRDLELMKPPTEAEKKEAMAQTSYPYNTQIGDYDVNKNETQTDLENKDIADSVIAGYDANTIKNSFNTNDDDEIKKVNKRLSNYRI